MTVIVLRKGPAGIDRNDQPLDRAVACGGIHQRPLVEIDDVGNAANVFAGVEYFEKDVLRQVWERQL